MAILGLFAGAAQRDRMQHRHIVAYDCRFAHDDGMGMVDHDALADAGSRVDIHTKYLRHTHLHEIGKIVTPLLPEPMTDTIGLHRLKALEKQQWLNEAMAGWVAVEHRHDIGTRCHPKRWISGIGFIGDLAQKLFGHLSRGQLLRHAIGQRHFQRSVMQHTAMDQAAQKRFIGNGLCCLFADAAPDRIDPCQFRLHLCHGFALCWRFPSPYIIPDRRAGP